MLRLSLIRHAKSAYPPGVADHDRPLNDRGLRDAPRIGEALAEGPEVDLAVVSTATRAQQTWRLAALEVPEVKAFNDAALYLASVRQILMVVSRHAAEQSQPPTHVAVVGHNPGLEELALWLAAPQVSAGYEQLVLKYPTSAIASLGIDAETWADASFDRGSATLLGFTVARG